MILNDFFHNLCRFIALLTLFIFQLNGSSKTTRNQCADYHKKCHSDDQRACCDDNSLCKYLESRNDFYCIRKAKLEDLCASDDECSEVLHAKCSTEKKCVCRADNIKINSTSCAPLLGAFCWKDEKCATNDTVCFRNQCQCKESHIRIDNQCITRNQTKLGASCVDDEGCSMMMHARCSTERKCICRVNNVGMNDTCVPLLRAFCWRNEKCATDNAVCKDSKCQCKNNHLESNDQCIPMILGSYCENDTVCKQIEFAKCSELKVCICSFNTIAMNRTSCLPLLTVPCRENDHCKVNNSICFDGECQCKPNYTYEESKCVPIYLNGYCQTNENCSKVEYAMCSEKYKCVCKDTYVTINRRTCAPSLGAACTHEFHCRPANLLCINNKCQYETNSYSLFKSARGHLGRACLTNEHCVDIPNSRCSNDGICICNSNTIALNKFTCVPILHGLCTNDHQCYQEMFYCSNNKCQCKPNFTAVSANQCTKTHLLYSCTDDSDCSDPWHSYCSNDGKCVCTSKNIASGRSTCLPLLDGYCWRDDQCMAQNSSCIDFRCVCKSDSIAVAGNMCLSLEIDEKYD